MIKVSRFNKKIALITIIMMTLLTVGIYGTSQVLADDLGTYPPIVQRIADKFGLNISDVEEVFNQEMDERHLVLRQNIEDRLSQAVADGKLTEEQKQALLAKRDEMEAEREANRLDRREEMQKWFSEQGIDPEVLARYGGFAMGFKRGFHQGFRVGAGQ